MRNADMHICTHLHCPAHKLVENNLCHRSVRHSPVALFGLDVVETANRINLDTLPFAKVDQIGETLHITESTNSMRNIPDSNTCKL